MLLFCKLLLFFQIKARIVDKSDNMLTIVSFLCRTIVHIMLLLTNCEVHTGEYSDRSLDVRTEQSKVHTKG